jgi:hypothetical protein
MTMMQSNNEIAMKPMQDYNPTVGEGLFLV